MNGPPSGQQFSVSAWSTACAGQPGLVVADEVNHADAVFVVLICRLPLVLGAGRTVVGKADAVPVTAAKILVQQTLVSTVEAVTRRLLGSA